MKKLYYSIGEVTKITGVEPHVLRYWEKVFPQLSPSKNKAGKRVYTDKNIQTVMELKTLIKDKKYSTAGAKKALRQKKQSPDKEDEINKRLSLKKDLQEIKLLLKRIHENL